MFNTLFAICLLVSDFNKSKDFYTGILGLKITYESEGFASFDLRGTLLAIFQKNKAVEMLPTKYMKSGGGVVIGFQVTDVDEACEQLKKKNVYIIDGPKKTSWGQYVAYFKDPDNNIWEISDRNFVET